MRYNYTICFIRRGSELLLLNRRKAPNMGLWNGVGGKLMQGESPLQGVLREVREETGLTLSQARFAGTVAWPEEEASPREAQSRVATLRGGRSSPAQAGQETGVGVPGRGGMFVFLAEVPDNMHVQTPAATDEGVLDWKPLEWITDPDNAGIVENIALFLPPMLSGEAPLEYFCIYEGRRMQSCTPEPVAADVLDLVMEKGSVQR
ncbi:NUDIX hydrolase [Paenibacillus sp. y28]|uniref:NUDIX hydrolase n=1 Tax=Paenibacillus sp. y28 TaxID=3129110 RepID=UPI003018E0B3